MLTSTEYAVDRGGSVCPVCESEDISAGTLEVDGTQVWSTVTCAACESKWDDVFTLQYYTNLDAETDVIRENEQERFDQDFADSELVLDTVD